jgi:hypothetical protein
MGTTFRRLVASIKEAWAAAGHLAAVRTCEKYGHPEGVVIIFNGVYQLACPRCGKDIS